MGEDHSLTGGGFGFVISGQSARLHEPAESPFDDPTPGLDNEAFGRGVAALDDVQAQAGMRGVCAQLRGQRAARGARVGPEWFEPGLGAPHGREHGQGARPIGDLGPP